MSTLRRISAAVTVVALMAAMTGCSQRVLMNTITSAPNAKQCVSNVGSTVADDASLGNAESLAMREEDFWGWIDTLEGTSEESYSRLAEELSDEPIETIAAFDARMTIQLYRLDDECRAAWYESHEGYVNDDVFLYARAETVSSGRKFFERAIQNDSLPHRGDGPSEGDGELLLYVGMNAARSSGASEKDWDDATYPYRNLSYETGSNPAGWPPASGSIPE